MACKNNDNEHDEFCMEISALTWNSVLYFFINELNPSRELVLR